jgi:glutathione-regulated potassium-efflux system ancillary protein KefC/glutathione-regulated potassium-efflux system protein KefB
MGLTAQIAVFLAATVIAVPLFRRFKLSAVLGYLAAGIVIGPWGLGLFDDVESILHFAEFGVVLLLFVIGLELQPSRLWVMRNAVFGAGTAQVAVTTAALAVVIRALGQPWPAALVIAFALSLSSTALILQVLAERGELTARHGRSAFAILLFQDLAIMPALVLLPMLAGSRDATFDWRAIALPIVAAATVVVAGRYALRPALRIVAATRAQDAFTAAALLVVVGTALLFESAGLSMALGAFIAGVLLADSEYRHELEADIEPFKGLLLGLFFIAVGMSANLGVLRESPLTVIALTVAYLAVKTAAVFVAARVARHDNSTAWRLGVALAGGGEFAFVLFALAAGDGLLDRATADLLVIVVTLSMAGAPLLIGQPTGWRAA